MNTTHFFSSGEIAVRREAAVPGADGHEHRTADDDALRERIFVQNAMSPML